MSSHAIYFNIILNVSYLQIYVRHPWSQRRSRAVSTRPHSVASWSAPSRPPRRAHPGSARSGPVGHFERDVAVVPIGGDAGEILVHERLQAQYAVPSARGRLRGRVSCGQLVQDQRSAPDCTSFSAVNAAIRWKSSSGGPASSPPGTTGSGSLGRTRCSRILSGSGVAAVPCVSCSSLSIG